MKETKKNILRTTWKVFLLALQLIVIVGLILFFFTQTWASASTDLSKQSSEPIHLEQTIVNYVFDICEEYPEVDPYIVLGIIYYESRFTPNVSSGEYAGLMQVSTYWHRDRAARLGVTDFLDPYGNILIGVDLISELLEKYDGDIYKTLKFYSGGSTSYPGKVVSRANLYREGHFYAIE